MKFVGIALAVVGILGIILAGLGVIGTLVSPAVAHVSPDEMIPGFVASFGCCASSALPLIAGAVLFGMSSGAE